LNVEPHLAAREAGKGGFNFGVHLRFEHLITMREKKDGCRRTVHRR
jgi:hypothetical protein